MAEPLIVVSNALSTITWTFDDPTGYALDPSTPGAGAFVLGNGSLTMAENVPRATLLGSNPTQTAAAWDVNENDADGADGLQTVAGETVDGVSAYDITATDNAAFKMRGNTVGTDIDANIVVRSAANPVQWQIHLWRFYANSSGTSNVGFIGTWETSTTPELGILWDPGHGTWPNTYILVSEGGAGWPTFNSEENSGVSRTTDGWVFVLWAGRTYTFGATDYYDRVVVMNGSVLEKDLFTTSIFSPPFGPRFGCIQEGAFDLNPAYFDSYKMWQGPLMRYPSVVVVVLPDARPSSMTSVTGYTVSTTTTGVDRGGEILVKYQVSTDGGQTFGAESEIANITSETFDGKGSDVIRVRAYMTSNGTVPDTGVAGLFAPLLNNIEITFLPAWREQLATEATWTEVV